LTAVFHDPCRETSWKSGNSRFYSCPKRRIITLSFNTGHRSDKDRKAAAGVGGVPNAKLISRKHKEGVTAMIDYGFVKEINVPFGEALDLVKKTLQEHKFGVLTTIDVKEKLKEKLDIDFKKYVILGACNPAMAHKALEAEENIGLLLPCNVVVYEKDGKTAVGVIRPTAAMGMVENADLKNIAREVENRLREAFDKIGR